MSKSVSKVVVGVNVSGYWFTSICDSPAEAYEAVRSIYDSALYKFDDSDGKKSEAMRTIMNVFDGCTIGHQGYLLSIARYEEGKDDEVSD